jgi:hypothetical protein
MLQNTKKTRKKSKINNSTANSAELNCFDFINIYNHNMSFSKLRRFKVKADNKFEFDNMQNEPFATVINLSSS